MKTKEQTLSMSKRWFAEIADLRAKFPLLMVVRDNSGENLLKELNEFFIGNRVKNYFSTLYEQRQVSNHAWKDWDGRIRTWKPILVQCNTEWCDLQECDVQGVSWNNPV
jgi:hypothetical protein